MSKYLIKTVETYRTDSEAEANELIESAKDDPRYEVIKSTIETRTLKAKGEIVDEWKRVSITKVFTEEKEPSPTPMPDYRVLSIGEYNK